MVGGMKSTVLPLIILTIIASMVTFAQTGGDKRPQTSLANPAKPQSSYLKASAIRIHFLEWNPKGKSTVVLLHGLYDSAETWESVAPLIAKNYRVIAIDRRGSGLTDKPLEGYDVPTLAKDVASLIEGLKLERVHLVGHSAGAGIALTVAANTTAKLESVTLVDGGFWPRRSEGVGPVEPAACKVNDADCVRSASIEYGNRNYDPEPLYAAVQVPALFVVAYPPEPEASKFSKEIDEAHSLVRSTVRKIRDGSFAVIRNSGHWIQRDQPTALAMKLQDFFSRKTRDKNE